MPEDLTTEDPTTEEAKDEESPGIVHDDIMKRLLDYQRNLREGASPDEAAEPAVANHVAHDTAESAADRLIDLVAAEAERDVAQEAELESMVEPEAMEVDEIAAVQFEEAIAPAETIPPEEIEKTGGESSTSSRVAKAELEERMANLERSFDGIATMLAALRQSFQDMAISADERLAEIEDKLAEARGQVS